VVQAGSVTEVPLSGGFVNDVVRVGDTVRRPQGARAGFVHRLLESFAGHGWGGAPRFLGVDGAGREILEFLDGQVAWRPDQLAQVRGEQALQAVARLVRQFHDLTAGTPLAQGQEVVCHNDLSPKNTIYRQVGDGSLDPVAFIDWDLAAPGARIHDVAHVCWQYIGLRPRGIEVARAADLMRLVSDAYGLDGRERLVETVLWWQDRCWRGIRSAAATGDPAMTRLCDAGIPQEIRDAYGWVDRNRSRLQAAL
jgi:Phosphotransferase enzyme family